jgi:hypothetical protein
VDVKNTLSFSVQLFTELYSASYFFISCFHRSGIACTTNPLKEQNNSKLRTMLIVGQVSSKEEANEITFIAKLFIVGQRARFLASNKQSICETVEESEDSEEE